MLSGDGTRAVEMKEADGGPVAHSELEISQVWVLSDKKKSVDGHIIVTLWSASEADPEEWEISCTWNVEQRTTPRLPNLSTIPISKDHSLPMFRTCK
jgi:hypothetical protein